MSDTSKPRTKLSQDETRFSVALERIKRAVDSRFFGLTTSWYGDRCYVHWRDYTPGRDAMAGLVGIWRINHLIEAMQRVLPALERCKRKFQRKRAA